MEIIPVVALVVVAWFIERRYHEKHESLMKLALRMFPAVFIVLLAAFGYKGYMDGWPIHYGFVAASVLGVVLTPLVAFGARHEGNKRRNA